MQNKKINESEIKPMENYVAPKLPSLSEADKNQVSLKKLPLRWAKNAAVMLGIGALGVTALSGCDYTGAGVDTPVGTNVNNNSDRNDRLLNRGGDGNGHYFVYNIEDEVSSIIGRNIYLEAYTGNEEFELADTFVHSGGSGMVIYIVYLTEQEALSIIRSRLEAVGLRFIDSPPNYTIFEDDNVIPSISLNLFDAENNVAFVNFNLENSNRLAQRNLNRDEIVGFFNLQTDIIVGVFTQNSFSPREWTNLSSPRRPSDEERESIELEARRTLIRHLDDQIASFVRTLRHRGIMD